MPAFDHHPLLAEFPTAASLLAAAARLHAAGYRHTDAYTPFPVEGLSEALGLPRSYVPLGTLLGGLIGAAGGYFMCWYANVINYPLNIGGRPHNSWPAWIPLTFELGVLGAALTGTIVMLVANGLPRLHHPVFDVPGFERASQDRFFLAIDPADPQFDPIETPKLLASLGPLAVIGGGEQR